MKNADFIVYDCETGGFDAEKNPIVQIALVALDGTTLEEKARYETMVKPYGGKIIEPDALRANGLKMSEINNGISLKELHKNILQFVKNLNPKGNKFNKPIRVGHNVQFDNDFWDEVFFLMDQDPYAKINSTSECTMLLCKLYGETEKLDLSTCCEAFGIELINAHKAMPDTLATANLFRALVNRLRNDSNNSGSSSSTAKKQEKGRTKFQF